MNLNNNHQQWPMPQQQWQPQQQPWTPMPVWANHYSFWTQQQMADQQRQQYMQ
ncbi:hypothetical protein ACLKA7_000680, partial [Drosophila subpalustris]